MKREAGWVGGLLPALGIPSEVHTSKLEAYVVATAFRKGIPWQIRKNADLQE